MSVSVIIPSYREEQWLNRTIANIFNTATGDIEVIVVLNGEWHPVDPRAKVIRNKNNEGERVAMNQAAEIATGTHLLRIDAHCDFSPRGWDQRMEEVTGPRDMTQAVLTAVRLRWSMLSKEEQDRWLASGKIEGQWHEWDRIPGHKYERCRLLPNYEAKWEKPNEYKPDICETLTQVMNKNCIPNMSSTGCGFMIQKEFYSLIGGADESYPIMGAIGEEFSVKTWMHGGKVQTRTDVIIGHIFGTGAYDTGGVLEARRRLWTAWGHRYGEIRQRFPFLDWSEELRPTAIQSEEKRTVIIDREDTTITIDSDGRVIRKAKDHFKYVWVDDGSESELTDDQIRLKYAPLGKLVGSRVLIANDDGVMIDQETGELAYTPIPGEHYQIPTDGPESCQLVDKTGE